MENKITAVNWIIQQIDNKVIGDGDYRTLSDIFEQAKAMEKEQIEDAFINGEYNIDSVGCLIDKNGSEQYYNETYGNQ